MIRKLKVKTIDSAFYDELGLLMRKERKNQRLSLMELSKKTGISRVQLEYYELGYTRIKDDKWKLICKVLGMKPEIKVSIKGN